MRDSRSGNRCYRRTWRPTLTRLIGVMLDEVGLAATLLAGWLLALIGSAFHILKARGVI